MVRRAVPTIAFVGYSGSGKTTLIERLLPLFTARGLKVATVKHHHGELEPDKPGKDSFRHRRAGATLTIVAAARRLFLVEELDQDPTVDEIIGRYVVNADLCIVEGFKRAKVPKIEVMRRGVPAEPIFSNDPYVLAVVSDEPVEATIPVFGTRDVEALFDFIMGKFLPERT